eukprot:29091-Pelagococcus_subviridis.AAC.5
MTTTTATSEKGPNDDDVALAARVAVVKGINRIYWSTSPPKEIHWPAVWKRKKRKRCQRTSSVDRRKDNGRSERANATTEGPTRVVVVPPLVIRAAAPAAVLLRRFRS